ncbi:hypothetical protein EVAR_72352_1 [Eumeta japonica]|uniref:Uncharacterized protein n=1 Tax=Eumeta variegata TaxID=151549 RepID=A0A4C1SZK9_EUMVA|nr:hypothetical protein EVAR_72352_1 [Eumeta japonica]
MAGSNLRDILHHANYHPPRNPVVQSIGRQQIIQTHFNTYHHVAAEQATQSRLAEFFLGNPLRPPTPMAKGQGVASLRPNLPRMMVKQKVLFIFSSYMCADSNVCLV